MYKTNAIYEYLKTKPKGKFNYFLINENVWVLIYATSDIQPKLILLASQLNDDLEREGTDFENLSFKLLEKFNAPIRILRFTEKTFSKNVVISDKENATLFSIETSKLYELLFEPYNLPADINSKTKPVNDATSSTFHVWQRNFLSGKIKVSDIDLIQYNDDYTPTKVFELKRSFQELEEWKPYTVDYPNFILLRRTIPEEISFFILYNLCIGADKIEDLTNIRVFKVEDDTPKIVKVQRGQNLFDFSLEQIFF